MFQLIKGNTRKLAIGQFFRALPMSTLVVDKHASDRDHVHVIKLEASAHMGPDMWGQPTEQRCNITMNMGTDFSKSSETDDLKYSLNYAVICKDMLKYIGLKNNRWGSVGAMTRDVAQFAMDSWLGINNLNLEVNVPSVHIRSKDIACEVNRSRAAVTEDLQDFIKIQNLRLLTLIGVFTFERKEKQFVDLDIKIPWPRNREHHISIKKIVDKIVQHVENSNFKTVEALAENICGIIGHDSYFGHNLKDLPISVKVIKLNAITDTEGVGVSCVRKPSELPHYDQKSFSNRSDPKSLDDSFNLPVGTNVPLIEGAWNTAFLAFGSNIEPRRQQVERAINLLRENPNVKVKGISSYFESEPMYFKDQSPFLNGCIGIETTLSPHELLELCKDIEYRKLGRVKKFNNGPRTIDLDIIFYLSESGEHVLVNDTDLTVPHPRMLERTFVLEPLCELLHPEFTHPVSAEPVFNHLENIYDNENPEDILWKIIPLPSKDGESEKFLKFKNVKVYDEILGISRWRTQSSALAMGVVNTTPDSFSDGSESYLDVNEKVEKVKKMINDGLRLSEQLIVDIGGCSTRPGSTQVSEEEEIERTIPLIKAIKACSDIPFDKVLLSIDTYRSKVAQSAIECGIDIVNDISAGSFDPTMFDVIANNPQIAYVLSHIRGDIATMSTKTTYGEPDGTHYVNGRKNTSESTVLIRNIGKEMADRYSLAMKKGVQRSQLILDPGIGFAKNAKQNLQIIKQTSLLKNYSYVQDNLSVNFRNIPVLVGPSRKKFLGTITKEDDPSKRDSATSSIAATCVGFDADIIRVHNVRECIQSIKLANELYRSATLT